MSLHVHQEGSGPALVLLHGWGMHGGIWDAVRNRLTPRFTLHIVDLPGHGHSRHLGFGSLAGLAATVQPCLPREYSLLGWSLGGQVALHLAATAGTGLRHLVLVSTTPSFVQRDTWPQAMAEPVLADFARRLRDDYRKTLINFLTLQMLNVPQQRALLADLRETLFARGTPHPDALAAGLELLATSDLRNLVAGVACPTLVIHGDRDALTPVAAGRWLADRMPQARLVEIKGGAHAPFLSHPDRFLDALHEFLPLPDHAVAS